MTINVLDRTVEVTDPVKVPGGLLDVATVSDVGAVIGRGVVWESALCALPLPASGVCDSAIDVTEIEKSFGDPSWGEDDPFGIYAGVECSPAFKDYERRARGVLEAGEGFAVERAFHALYLDTATDITPGGTAVGITEALAIMEQTLPSTIGSRGMLHVSRFGGAFLASKRGVKSDSNHVLWTAQGTPIASGAGYFRTGPGGVAPTNAAKGFWLYGGGIVDVFRGDVEYHQGIDVTTNTERGLAERLYVASQPCAAIAIEINPDL